MWVIVAFIAFVLCLLYSTSSFYDLGKTTSPPKKSMSVLYTDPPTQRPKTIPSYDDPFSYPSPYTNNGVVLEGFSNF